MLRPIAAGILALATAASAQEDGLLLTGARVLDASGEAFSANDVLVRGGRIVEVGTEGAAFADVALRDAIAGGMIPGPRVYCATRALVATGCYGPSGFDPRWEMPVGGQVALVVFDGAVAVDRTR